MWLRSDFSLAITGFLAALAPQIEEENRRDRIASARERLQDPAYLNPIELEEFDCRVSEEGYAPWPFSEGEWIIHGTVSDAIYEGDEEHGSVKEDLQVPPIRLTSSILTRRGSQVLLGYFCQIPRQQRPRRCIRVAR